MWENINQCVPRIEYSNFFKIRNEMGEIENSKPFRPTEKKYMIKTSVL